MLVTQKLDPHCTAKIKEDHRKVLIIFLRSSSGVQQIIGTGSFKQYYIIKVSFLNNTSESCQG